MRQAPIELSEYNPQWPSMFEAEKNFLIKLMGQWLCGSVEHVGSTSVPVLLIRIIFWAFSIYLIEALSC